MPKVDFVWAGPGRDVSVIGNFNREKPLKLELSSKRGGPAVFRGEIRVTSLTQKTFYKFLVDGRSTLDNAVAQEDWQGHGLRNVALPRNSKSSMPYPYRKLDFDNYDFRVLVLKPRDNPQGTIDYINCSLEHDSLINPKPYLALSYCWGDATDGKDLQIGGYYEQITSSLALAMLAVRRLRCLNTPIRLWVDALCINQTDNEERSNQVRNMRQIYAKSSEVISWVGKGSLCGYPSEAVEYLIKKQSLINRLNDGSSSVRNAQMLLDDFSSFSFATKEDWMANQLNIMDAFFNQPYWKRVWIIQEVTVAPKATIVWGKAEIP